MSQFLLDLPSAKNVTGGKAVLRRDVQGLRAVAVLAVVSDHLLGYPLGGFVGVDIFFVISGFLITGLLLREQEKNGRISYANFYRRRIRRIMPVAVIVIAATVAASWIVFPVGRAESVSVDGVWALIFGANWHLALLGTDYMQAEGPISPLQHYWSLAVEEQFYVVWPWLIVLVLGFAASRLHWRAARSRAVLAGIFLVVILASFAFAVWETTTIPSVAYFSTISRTWELAIGALLAVSAGAFANLSQTTRTVLGYTGLAGIAWSLFSVTPELPFPGPWAAVPVLATALVIAAGTGVQKPFPSPLANPVAGYIGDISYSLYLWHFPVITIFSALSPKEDSVLWTMMIFGMFALSIASYHFIEDPIRHSSWLEPGRKGWDRRKESQREINKYAGLAVLALATALVVTLALTKADAPVDASGFQAQAVDLPDASDYAEVVGMPKTPAQELSTELTAALSTVEWPRLEPSVDVLRDQFVPEWKDDKCLDVTDANMTNCVYGDAAAQKTAVLLGDSVSISWMPGLRGSLAEQGWKIQSLTKGQCPAIGVAVTRPNNPEGFTEACAAHQSWALNKVAQIQPDMVIVTSSMGAASLMVGLADGDNALNAWGGATIERLRALQAISDAEVVLLSPSATGKNLMECATNFSKPRDCVANGSNFFDILQVEESAAASVPGVRYVSTWSWFCTPTKECPAFAGSTPIFVDGGHITPAYSAKLAPVLEEALLGDGE